MGRHSAPDDPDDVRQPPAAVAVRERGGSEAPGRHASPDAGGSAASDRFVAPGSAAINGVAPSRPLPSRPAADDVTERIPPVVDEPAQVSSPRPAPVATAPPPPPPHAALRHAAQNSAADLHLVRSHRGVLALCAAAVLVPFVVEAVVLLVLGHLDGHRLLVWLWAPLVAAGVLLGVTLDLAHRRHNSAPPVPQ